MSDELESLASAYLDDELPPEARASVEHALSADASLAEEVRSLAVVRDIVAALPRPAGPDVSRAVLGRIAAPRRRLIAAPTRTTWIVTATAAGLMAIAFGLATASRSRHTHVNPPPVLTHSSVDSQPVATIVTAETAVDPGPVGPPATLAAPAAPKSVVEDRAVAALEILSRPGTHRVFLVSVLDDAIDANETAALLEISSHRNFFRLDVPASEEAPGQPGAVFAAELDPSELATLRRRLSGAFTGRIDEVEADHLNLTRLASMSQVTALKGDPAGEVLFPQNRMALQSAAVVDHSAISQSGSGRTEGASPSTPAASAEVAPRSEDRPSIVLVWLVRGAER
ncbi:anti-sigma factor family protein [Paludisphaera rhizosphaerae]|uniref:anti-sigma factor family protein n=1 Tax=Paludisphaera rhizosphaerae TaxID=2711216 RepID=UPI0013EDBBDA|nr:hypothetical protein [Paludisphaera rhizosphaerae]